MRTTPLKKIVQRTAILTAIGSVVLLALYLLTKHDLLYTLTITCATTCYHFVMRLLVGQILLHSKPNAQHPWFTQRRWEAKLYKFLKVKQWKKYMPTYNPEEFSFQELNATEIITNMCRAELVHEVIVLLSFAPLLLSGVLGGFWAFFITSIVAAFIDSVFVLLQRFNRPRVRKMIQGLEKRTK